MFVDRTDRLRVQKSEPLAGEISLAGAKNSALRLLAASLLTADSVSLTRYPGPLSDAQIHVEMLEVLGKTIRRYGEQEICIEESQSLTYQLEWQGRSIRNTLLILGALTSRLGPGSVPLPGGCKLGDRKYDIHVMLLRALGAQVCMLRLQREG